MAQAILNLLSAGALEGLLRTIIPEFTRTNGCTVNLSVGTIGIVRARLAAGESPDLVILSPPAIDAMEKDGSVIVGSRADICRVEVGVAVPDGAPLPDISTPDAFRRTLLAARAITATDPRAGGTAGVHFAALLERMGIADTVRGKCILWDTGRAVIDTLASGKADLGITFISEFLLTGGIRVLGPLPREMSLANTYTAAVPTRSAAAASARDFILFLTAHALRARFEKLGLKSP